MIPNRDMITAWHRHASISSPGVAVVASRRENPVQVVLAGPQVASWTHAGLHLGITDISCRCTRLICTACFVVWWPRRAANTSTNQRQGSACHCTTNMTHVPDTAEAVSVISRPSLSAAHWKRCLTLPMNTGKQTGDCFVACVRSPVGGALKTTLLLLLFSSVSK